MSDESYITCLESKIFTEFEEEGEERDPEKEEFYVSITLSSFSSCLPPLLTLINDTSNTVIPR